MERAATMTDNRWGRETMPYAQGEMAEAAKAANPYQLNCQNGIVDLRTGKLSPGRLAPVEYHPGATSSLWDGFLHDATGGDGELEAFLRRACGYSLTGSAKEGALFYIHGLGATGKSTFLETIKAAFGGYAVAADTEARIPEAGKTHKRPGGPMLANLWGRRRAR